MTKSFIEYHMLNEAKKVASDEDIVKTSEEGAAPVKKPTKKKGTPAASAKDAPEETSGKEPEPIKDPDKFEELLSKVKLPNLNLDTGDDELDDVRQQIHNHWDEIGKAIRMFASPSRSSVIGKYINRQKFESGMEPGTKKGQKMVENYFKGGVNNLNLLNFLKTIVKGDESRLKEADTVDEIIKIFSYFTLLKKVIRTAQDYKVYFRGDFDKTHAGLKTKHEDGTINDNAFEAYTELFKTLRDWSNAVAKGSGLFNFPDIKRIDLNEAKKVVGEIINRALKSEGQTHCREKFAKLFIAYRQAVIKGEKPNLPSDLSGIKNEYELIKRMAESVDFELNHGDPIGIFNGKEFVTRKDIGDMYEYRAHLRQEKKKYEEGQKDRDGETRKHIDGIRKKEEEISSRMDKIKGTSTAAPGSPPGGDGPDGPGSGKDSGGRKGPDGTGPGSKDGGSGPDGGDGGDGGSGDSGSGSGGDAGSGGGSWISKIPFNKESYFDAIEKIYNDTIKEIKDKTEKSRVAKASVETAIQESIKDAISHAARRTKEAVGRAAEGAVDGVAQFGRRTFRGGKSSEKNEELYDKIEDKAKDELDRARSRAEEIISREFKILNGDGYFTKNRKTKAEIAIEHALINFKRDANQITYQQRKATRPNEINLLARFAGGSVVDAAKKVASIKDTAFGKRAGDIAGTASAKIKDKIKQKQLEKESQKQEILFKLAGDKVQLEAIGKYLQTAYEKAKGVFGNGFTPKQFISKGKSVINLPIPGVKKPFINVDSFLRYFGNESKGFLLKTLESILDDGKIDDQEAKETQQTTGGGETQNTDQETTDSGDKKNTSAEPNPDVTDAMADKVDPGKAKAEEKVNNEQWMNENGKDIVNELITTMKSPENTIKTKEDVDAKIKELIEAKKGNATPEAIQKIKDLYAEMNKQPEQPAQPDASQQGAPDQQAGAASVTTAAVGDYVPPRRLRKQVLRRMNKYF